MGFDITGLGAVFDFGSKVIDKIFPDQNAANAAKLEMLKMQQAGDFKELELEFANAQQQLAVNAEQAKNPSVFVSGGRPAAMWACVMGLVYTFLLQPLLAWASTMIGQPVPPPIDTSLLIQLLIGMLGLAGIRSFDKKNGTAAK